MGIFIKVREAMAELGRKVNAVIPLLKAAGEGGERALGLVRDLAQAGIEAIVVIAQKSEGDALLGEVAQVLVAPEPNRGAQLRLGAGHTTREWILFLHADSQLNEGWEKVLADFIGSSSHAVAVFRFSLDDKGLRARWLARLVRLRCALFGLPYGDQGLLIHRSAYLKAGGYQPQPLMEDVALMKKFTKKEICFLDHPLTTSAEKFRKRGYLRQSAKNLFILLLYFLGARPSWLARFY